MEESVQILLVEQVREHLNGLPAKDRIREAIYNYFLPQCDQYEITEEEFYKLILKPAFKEADAAPDEDPDPVNRKGTFVKIFGVTLHSLKRLGEVLFENPTRQKVYFEDSTFLKNHVDALEDADVAIEYTILYKSEKDTEKRYLKICYQLNPALPYRIQGQLFATLTDLLNAGFESKPLMDEIYDHYKEGKLHIWLHARDAKSFPPAPAGKTMVFFLNFVYGVNSGYPFFIGEELFYSPMQLVVTAQKNIGFWAQLMEQCDNGNLYTWFDALGQADWRLKLKTTAADIQQNVLIGKDEKDYAFIQQLLYLIDPDVIRPLLNTSQLNVDLANMPTTKLVAIPVEISLKTAGFVKARFALKPAHQGIWLDKTEATLFDLTDQKQVTVTLNIDPQQLKKDTLHNSDLLVVTDYETLKVRISVKAVFPLNTYLLYLAKYAGFGGLFFALFRWLVSAGTGLSDGLFPQIVCEQYERSLPDNWPVFFWVFLFMLGGFIGSYFIIRKVEEL